MSYLSPLHEFAAFAQRDEQVPSRSMEKDQLDLVNATHLCPFQNFSPTAPKN